VNKQNVNKDGRLAKTNDHKTRKKTPNGINPKGRQCGMRGGWKDPPQWLVDEP